MNLPYGQPTPNLHWTRPIFPLSQNNSSQFYGTAQISANKIAGLNPSNQIGHVWPGMEVRIRPNGQIHTPSPLLEPARPALEQLTQTASLSLDQCLFLHHPSAFIFSIDVPYGMFVTTCVSPRMLLD